MDADELLSSWTKIEKASDAAGGAYADASLSSLSRNQPRQALQNLTKGIKYFSLRAIARSDFKSKKLKPPKFDIRSFTGDIDTIENILDPKFTTEVEADLAKKDGETSAAIAADETMLMQRLEPEQYSHITTQTLHRVFYESALLPCNCIHRKEPFSLAKQHACVLRMNSGWDSAGNSSHYFFEAVLAIDDKYDWKKIQFRIPRYNTLLRMRSILLSSVVTEKIQKSC
jgi:hypothetical protein